MSALDQYLVAIYTIKFNLIESLIRSKLYPYSTTITIYSQQGPFHHCCWLSSRCEATHIFNNQSLKLLKTLSNQTFHSFYYCSVNERNLWRIVWNALELKTNITLWKCERQDSNLRTPTRSDLKSDSFGQLGNARTEMCMIYWSLFCYRFSGNPVPTSISKS